MIRDKKKKTLIAENDIEAGYWQAAQSLKNMLTMMDAKIKRIEKDLSWEDKKIIEQFREGAKESLRRAKAEKEVNKEVLSFLESKINYKDQ